MKLIDKDALVAEIERLRRVRPSDSLQPTEENKLDWLAGKAFCTASLKVFLDTLEVKEVGVWKTVDNINTPQADRNKIYCVFTKDRYILATVINHPKEDELLQWKCTEFPFHRYDMCEGDKYMQIA